MRRQRIADVLVVGAGPVGSTIACRLAERGLEVDIVDERFGRADARTGSVLLYPDTIARLTSLGVNPRELGPTRRLERLGIYSARERKGELPLGEGPNGAPIVASLAGVERAIGRRLAEQRVGVSFQRRVCDLRPETRGVDLRIGEIMEDTSGYAVMHIEGVVGHMHDESAAWVVGADGADSIIRSRLDLDLEPAAEPALYAALELSTRGPASDEMRIVLDDDIAATCWPLPTGGHRWTFRLPDTRGYREELRKIRPEPTVRHLVQLLSRRLPWLEADPDHLEFAEVEHFQPAFARKFGEGRVWLAGEAAHRVDPLAGRALNEGLLEADRLADRIASALEGTLPASGLGGYEREMRTTLAPVFEPGRWFDGTAAKDPFLAQSYERVVPLLPGEGEDLDRLSAALGLARRRAA